MSRQILAIEDDRAALANLRDILEMDGHRVIGAGTLKEAVDGHAWADYSVILLDRRLPDGTADAILPHIQAAAPNTAVVTIITGYADLDGTIAALRFGAADYLLKPINPGCSAPPSPASCGCRRWKSGRCRPSGWPRSGR